jgi:MarR family transcriptional regulator, organic hydroperoxide resistance regulator
MHMDYLTPEDQSDNIVRDELFVTNYIEPEVRTIAREVARLYPAVHQRFQASRQTLPGTDVTPRMLVVLRHLVAAGPLTVGEQAQHLGLSKAAATELVNRLEAKALVARLRDDRDRRRVFVWLTAEGRQRVAAHPEVLENDLLARAIARMRPEDRTHLVEGLRALLDAGKESEE